MTASVPGLFTVQQFGDSGMLASLYRLYTYEQGTTTFKAAYTDMAGSVPHAYVNDGLGGQYIALNARGELPAPLYLDNSVAYDISLKRPDGSTVWTRRADAAAHAAAIAAEIAEAHAALVLMLGSSTGASMVGGTWFGGVVATISALATSAGASLIGFIQSGVGAVARSLQSKAREVVSITDFSGCDPTGATFSTEALQAAIVSLRANPVSIIDTIGGSTITVYSSGVVNIPRGVFKIAPDTLKIYQDLGLTLRGEGSRRTNNAVRAPTTILISGTSSGFGIQAYRSGGRGLTIEDMDICYETSAFTGSVLDVVDSPGVTLNRVFLGTNGITGGTRLQSAAACIRSTYDEFMTFNNCVFDGAHDGWWADDARTELANPFGGFGTTFNQCVWYDFTGDMIRHDGLRTREVVMINNCAFNPISVDCTRGVDLTNVEGVQINGGIFTPSVSNKAGVEWIRLSNCTGHVRGVTLSDLSPAGTFDGMLDLSNNRVYCTQGFEITGGVITGKGNEFSKCSSGWKASPASALCFDLGPDFFKAAVTNAYYIPADSALISGRINYNSAGDASTNGVINTSARVSIENIDKKQTSVSTTGYVFSNKADTGRTVVATGSSNLTFNLGTPAPGVRFKLVKASTGTLRVDAAVVGQLYTGVGPLKTSVIAGAATDIGGTVEIEAYGTAGWFVRYNGAWTLT